MGSDRDDGLKLRHSQNDGRQRQYVVVVKRDDLFCKLPVAQIILNRLLSNRYALAQPFLPRIEALEYADATRAGMTVSATNKRRE